MDFDGKTVLITGAGKGIGRATAMLLAERGAKVVALARTRSDLEALEAEIGSRSVVADLADAAAAREGRGPGFPPISWSIAPG